MREHDVIVIGSGSGAIVTDEALEHGYSVALIDKGKLGGTCLNVGCIPSKLLIYPAERISEIKDSEKLGIKAEVNGIDFEEIMKRMRDSVSSERNAMRKGIERSGMEYYDEKLSSLMIIP